MNALIALVAVHGAALVFFVTFAARLGAPIPAVPVIVIVGALVGHGNVSVPAAFACAIVGSTLGDAAWFLAGKRYGYSVLRMLCRVSLSPDSCVSQNESMFARWGGRSLIAAKFVPGISVVAPPMAGALGMPVVRFLWFELLGSAIWAAVFLLLGYAFRGQIQGLLDLLSTMGEAAVALLLAAVLVYVAMLYRRRRAAARAAEITRISVDELVVLGASDRPPIVVDVRGDSLRQLDPRRIPGAIAIPLGEVAAQSSRLARDREIVVYCNCPNEHSAALACRAIMAAGHPSARPLVGGVDAWSAAGLPLETYVFVVAQTAVA